MRFTPEQAAVLQARMIDAHEAKLAADKKLDMERMKELLSQIEAARSKMIDTWIGDDEWNDLIPLVPSAEQIASNDDMYLEILHSMENNRLIRLFLEYEGIIVAVGLGDDDRIKVSYWGTRNSNLFVMRDDAKQDILAYFGKRLLDQAAAERKAQAQEQAFEDAIEPVIDAVLVELEKACRKHGSIRNQHELIAVLFEEFLEFWEEVRKAQNSAELSPAAIKELIQIAAMGLRGLMDLGAFKE